MDVVKGDMGVRGDGHGIDARGDIGALFLRCMRGQSESDCLYGTVMEQGTHLVWSERQREEGSVRIDSKEGEKGQ